MLQTTCETETRKTLQKVPVWYRPNTLRRLSQREFLQLQNVRVGKITRTLLCEGFGVFIVVELTLISQWRGYFLVGKILINTCNLWDSFLVRIPSIIVERRVQDIFILGFLETTHATKVPRRCHEGDIWLQQMPLMSAPIIFVRLLRDFIPINIYQIANLFFFFFSFSFFGSRLQIFF